MTRLKFYAVLVMTMALFAISLAQTGTPSMPEPLAKLMMWEGMWEAQATLSLEGKSYPLAYHADFRKTADGNGLIMEERFDHPDLGNLRGSNLIGCNANDGKIHWFSVDNFGTVHEHVGMWKSPDHFFMEARETMAPAMENGKPAGKQRRYLERIDFHVKGRNTLEFNLVATIDGKPYEEITGTFTRR